MWPPAPWEGGRACLDWLQTLNTGHSLSGRKRPDGSRADWSLKCGCCFGICCHEELIPKPVTASRSHKTPALEATVQPMAHTPVLCLPDLGSQAACGSVPHFPITDGRMESLYQD